MSRTFFAICMALMMGLWHPLSHAVPLSEISPDYPAGRFASYLKEAGAQLTLQEAVAAQKSGKFSASGSPILTFGIGSRPAWLHLSVLNPANERIDRRLVIENSWLDHIDAYFLKDGQLLDSYSVGDSRRQAERPIPGRFFSFDHAFDSGTTDIYLRIATPDPIVVPIYLLSPAEASHRETMQGYSYGFIYGYLLALLAYNLLLYLKLRYKRLLLYAAFLGTFILMNIAYTGHGFAWIWPDNVALQRWIIPVLMVFFGISGLAFAGKFLDTRANFPRTHRIVARISGLFLVLLAAAFIADSQLYALLTAFAFVIAFSITMPILGLMSLHSGYQPARYFLAASIASMLGTIVTALSVWGFIPFSDLKFRAVELGMLIDATLLALALANQLRSIQVERLLAEQRAARDPLTDLYNRRSFLEMAQAIWSTSRRNGRELSVIMLDLDHFKSINDRHGHAAGDAVLVATARVLTHSARQGDIVARWGGEEFLFLLPETKLDAAIAMAERLKEAISQIRVPSGGEEVILSASFGVAQKSGHENLEALISEADALLYRAKQAGRNRISA